GRNSLGAAGDLEGEGLGGGDSEGVVPGDGDEPGFDVVEAPSLGTEWEDAEAEVEFGGGAGGDFAIGYVRESGVFWVCFEQRCSSEGELCGCSHTRLKGAQGAVGA